MTRLATVRISAAPERWAALGFDTTGGVAALANGAVEFAGDHPGSSALGVTGLERACTVDGLDVGPASAHPATHHPNGARAIDHVVVMTDSLDRTSQAIESSLGLERRRLRETDTVRQAFHRFADPIDAPAGERGCIIELVENQRVTAPEFWGLVVIVDDLDALHESHPDLVARPKPAVQPGRRIATARREADLGTAVAFMTP